MAGIVSIFGPSIFKSLDPLIYFPIQIHFEIVFFRFKFRQMCVRDHGCDGLLKNHRNNIKAIVEQIN